MGGSVKQSLTAANQPDPGAFRGKAKAMARPVTAAGACDKGNLYS
jgi:hypothetical protein